MWQGQVIADSQQTIEVDGYHYFPQQSVRMALLVRAVKSESDLRCPHGVQFYDVTDGKRRGERNAWSYEKPAAAMQQVAHFIGFWDQVEVQA